MESKKCNQCGLVSWIDNETISCQRCGSPIWNRNDYGAGFGALEATDTSIFSGVIKVQTILLGVAILILLVFRGFGLVDGDTGKVIAIPIILVGIGLAVGMNLWLLIRIFGESVGWGLASLFVPFAGLIALIKFWDKTQRPFIGHVLSVGIILVGILTGGIV